MDPLTHAASGAVAMLACPRRPLTAWAVPLAALAAAAPDIDIIFAYTPLDFLLLHRGITHSLAAVPLFGLLLAVLFWPLWRAGLTWRWSLGRVWLFGCLMLLLHIWLDVITTYGTMIFLPFSHERVRLNGVFIIDLLLTVPLLWAVWRWRARQGLLLLTLAWIVAYPAAAIALNHWHTGQNEARLTSLGRQVTDVTVLPDAFSPFYWRLLYAETVPEGRNICEQSLNAMGQPRGPVMSHTAARPEAVAGLSAQSVMAKAFFDFTLLPVQSPLPLRDAPRHKAEKTELRLYYDLRFGSGLAWVRWLMQQRPNADIPFQFMTASEEGRLTQVRMRFSDSGRDSGWQLPRKPTQPGWGQWLAGLY
ncbi:MAG: metal-dependent hydrolase [Desulfovibrio sp.]|nr:metal-dependent hydrolase [Desulfovibrio sp.]